MTNNIYDTANQLERDLRNLDAYKALQESLRLIQADSESLKLYQEFREKSQEYQMKLIQGQTVSDEELAGLQELTETIKKDKNIFKLMNEEQQIGQVIKDINTIITKPLNKLYEISE